jgi:hypothetical protein
MTPIQITAAFGVTRPAVQVDLKLVRTTRVFDDTLLVLFERSHHWTAGRAFVYLTALLESARGRSA